MSAAGHQLDAIMRDVERRMRSENPNNAASAMRALARLVAAGEVHDGGIHRRLLGVMESANVPEWRGRACVEWLMAHLRDPASAARPPALTRTPPDILLGTDGMTRAIDEAESAVLGAGHALYQRAGVVVQVAASRDAPEMQVVEVAPERLHELMDGAARFIRVDPKDGKEKRAACGIGLAKTYLARRGIGWNLPTLAGVISAPTMRADGSILDMPGYDSRTGLYLDTAGVAFPEIADRPTRDDAERGIETLAGLLAEFPFVDDTDEAVALAAMLTAACRRGLPAAPMFAFTAPAPGTGKSYLVDIVAHLSTGAPASGLSYSDDQHENRKVIDSALLAGASLLVFDNVTAELAGDRLNQVLTQPSVTLRVLGQSRNVVAACGALVMANGNSLTIAADMTRRTMLCRLDAGVERPELREFVADPVAELAADRGRYLVAALTVLRAYHVAGRPNCPRPLASFQAWSDLVRGALLWLGYADPVASMEHVRANDPKRSDHLAVMQAWNSALGNDRVSSRRIIEASQQNGDLREALLAVAGVAGNTNTARLGKWLRSHRDKLAGGMRISNAGFAGGVALWRLDGGNVLPLRAADIDEGGVASLLE